MNIDLDTDTLTRPDPLDQLVPPARPWWMRFIVAAVVVGLVGVVSFLVGRGYLYPRPDCCGSGSSPVDMMRSPGGKSVVVSAYFFNSSQAGLDVTSVSVHLPGAHVVSAWVVPGPQWSSDPASARPLPQVVRRGESAHVLIEFVPDSCVDTFTSWGTVDLHLEVRNGWLPSIGRTFRIPGHVVDAKSGVNVDSIDQTTGTNVSHTPLAAACQLLAAPR